MRNNRPQARISMPTPINFICVLTIILIGLSPNAILIAQNEIKPTNSFKEVLPNLDYFESGYKFGNDPTDDKNYFSFKPVPGTPNHFIAKGVTVTTDMLKKYIGSSYISQDGTNGVWQTKGEKRNYNKPTILSLKIHCTEFIMNESIWLPECPITIHAETINMNSYNLKTDPLPWADPELIDYTEADGKQGLNAGDVTIIA